MMPTHALTVWGGSSLWLEEGSTQTMRSAASWRLWITFIRSSTPSKGWKTESNPLRAFSSEFLSRPPNAVFSSNNMHSMHPQVSTQIVYVIILISSVFDAFVPR